MQRIRLPPPSTRQEEMVDPAALELGRRCAATAEELDEGRRRALEVACLPALREEGTSALSDVSEADGTGGIPAKSPIMTCSNRW